MQKSIIFNERLICIKYQMSSKKRKVKVILMEGNEMKVKLWKRILTLVLASSMMFGDSAIGFAAEYQSSVDSSYEIASSEMIITAGNEEKNGGGSEGVAVLAIDGNENTIWHTEWYPKENNTHEDHWLQIELNNIY